MPTSLYIHYILNKTKPAYSIRFFLYGVPNLVFILNVIICHFSGGDVVMWTTSHCFDFFACNLMYIVSICTKVQTTHGQTNIDQLQKHFFSHITCTGGGGGWGLLLKVFA